MGNAGVSVFHSKNVAFTLEFISSASNSAVEGFDEVVQTDHVGWGVTEDQVTKSAIREIDPTALLNRGTL